MRTRGAPRLTAREDPLTFILRDKPGRELLEKLRPRPFMIPVDLRKSVGMHPETFRRLIAYLSEYGLVMVRAVPGARFRRVAHGLASIRIGIEVTPTGKALLDVAKAVRSTVRQHSRALPEASAEHWLPA